MNTIFLSELIVGIEVTVIGGIILAIIARLYNSFTKYKKPQIINYYKMEAKKSVRNNVSELIKNIPSNRVINSLYKILCKYQMEWSSDAIFMGSRVYLTFKNNVCSYEVVGIMYSNTRSEKKIITVLKYHETITSNVVLNSVIPGLWLTQISDWNKVIKNILELCSSDIERLELCSLLILPNTKETSILMSFEVDSRRWHRHFLLKENCLYEKDKLVFNYNN